MFFEVRVPMSESDFDFELPSPGSSARALKDFFSDQKGDSHSPRGGRRVVPEAEAPKSLSQSTPIGWPARVPSFGLDFLDATVAKVHVEDFLFHMVKPPAPVLASSLTAVVAGMHPARGWGASSSRQSLLSFTPSAGAVSTHPFATAANTPGDTRSRSFTADNDEVEDVEASKPKPPTGKREKKKSHCRVCGEPGHCGQGTHSLCAQPLKGRLPPSSPSFDLNVDQHQVLAPRAPRRSGAVLGPPAHSACGHRTVLYSACPARAARDADVLVAFANRACT